MKKNVFLSVGILVFMLFCVGVFFFTQKTPVAEGQDVIRWAYASNRILVIPCLCNNTIIVVAGPSRPAIVSVLLTWPWPLRSRFQTYTGASVGGVYVPTGECLLLTPLGCIPITTMGTALIEGSAIPRPIP